MRAPFVPVFPAGAPVSVLVDYDGTVSRRDIGDVLLAEHALVEQAVVVAKDADYDAGRAGSRELMQWDMEVLPRDGDLLRAVAARIPQDETFPVFVAAVREAGAAIEVVSDGLAFYVASNLARLDPSLADLPIATNENDVDGDGRMWFPYGHPACFVCGTCKRERVRAHEAGGRVVVFVGDGQSDRYAAHHADVVWAKDALLAWGRASGRDFLAWDRFAEIEAWFRAALADGRLPVRAEPTSRRGGRRTGRCARTSSAARRSGGPGGPCRNRSGEAARPTGAACLPGYQPQECNAPACRRRGIARRRRPPRRARPAPPRRPAVSAGPFTTNLPAPRLIPRPCRPPRACPRQPSAAGPYPQRSKRANSSKGTQPRFSDGDRTSGSGRPTGITPIGTNSSGMPSSARSATGPKAPAKPEARPASDRGEHDHHHRGPDVDPPVGDRPVDLAALVVDLVGLPVAPVVDLR